MSPSDQKVDRLLRQSFEREPDLSADFETRVMSSIRENEKKAGSSRTMLIVMLLYWTGASLAGSWILLESVPAGAISGNPMVLIPVLSLIAAGIIFLVRQSKLKISDLFLQTIQ